MRRSARSYTRRYGRRVSSRLVGYWNNPRPILKYAYKQSINVGDEWEFGWGHFDTDYYQLDFNSEILFNDASSLPKYLALQYGRWIIIRNKYNGTPMFYNHIKFTFNRIGISTTLK